MKIAVSAASGHLATAFIDRYIRDVDEKSLVALARNPDRIKNKNIEHRKADYNSEKEFELALKDIDVLLFISSNADPERRKTHHENVVKAAVKTGVQKIVYTSVIGSPDITRFAPIVKSNRDTEEMIKNSGLKYIICRNGLYIEPDLEAIPTYIKNEKIRNSAGSGKCSYTSRDELACAYSILVRYDNFNGRILNMTGESVTQEELAEKINSVYDTKIVYEEMTVDEFYEDRIKAHGEFYGSIIGGIYEMIRQGAFNVDSDFEQVAGHHHKKTIEFIKDTAY